jgi:uncharacterized cofD-like protein
VQSFPFIRSLAYNHRVMTTSLKSGSSRWTRLLRPGLGLKRWILLLLFGVTIAALGIAISLRGISQDVAGQGALDWHTLDFLPIWVRSLALVALGFGLTGFAVLRFNRSLMAAVLPESQQPTLAMMNALVEKNQRRHGPKVVAIGGGTGMPQLLRGLRAYTDNITAIVTVADDGGSSGRLRKQMGVLPPGDFRNNIASLSEAEDLMTRLFQYRFADREVTDDLGMGSELAGHSFGNLFIATMAAVTGSFEAGIAESSRVLAVRGRVLPSTLEHVTLGAEISKTGDDGAQEWLTVLGESQLAETGGQITRVYLQPEQPRAYPEAVRAILQADLIIASPGSFYTSLLPNLLVPAIRDAIHASSAQRIFVCNVATQPGETDGFSLTDHLDQLRIYAGTAFENVLANSNYDVDHPPSANGRWVLLPDPDEPLQFRLFTGDLVDEDLPWHHSSAKLAARLMQVYAELLATSPQREPHTSHLPIYSRAVHS